MYCATTYQAQTQSLLNRFVVCFAKQTKFSGLHWNTRQKVRAGDNLKRQADRPRDSTQCAGESGSRDQVILAITDAFPSPPNQNRVPNQINPKVSMAEEGNNG